MVRETDGVDMTYEQQLEFAVGQQRAGKVDEAERVYRGILAERGEDFPALFLLGSLLIQTGKSEEAIGALRQAIALQPRYAEAHYNLGIALQNSGRVGEAAKEFLEAAKLKPDFVDAHNNLGIALKDLGKFDLAAAAGREVVRLKPDFAEGHYNLGIALFLKGEYREAIAIYRRALELKPSYALAQNNLGNVLLHIGEVDEAIAAYRDAIAADPKYAQAHYNLGTALHRKGDLDGAIAAHHQAIALDLKYFQAFNNLGNVLKDNGRIDEAMGAFRKAIAIKPDFAEAHSNLVFAMQYDSGATHQSIREELERWNQAHAKGVRTFPPRLQGDRTADRRLRIGYVSPDFCQHVVGRNILPLLKNHDRAEVEVFCYSSVVKEDGMTEEFRRLGHGWRNIFGVSDDKAAEMIRADGIDILVDLALHTAGNRLGIFAREPAPVQATFAGYPGSTGLSTIDYRLTDPYLDPEGQDENWYSETSWRLPHTFWCYQPMVEVEVGELPWQKNGLITFGCLNNFCKVNEPTLRMWAKVMKAVPDSRLLMIAPAASARDRVRGFLNREGIAVERLEFVGRQSRAEYLRTYHRIDIGLDTTPYNGHTTSLDSYWMGAPVVTLVGERVVGRAGLSQLSNLGLEGLAARSEEEFVGIAVGLAKDAQRLAGLRGSLRGRMEKSPLMDAAGFARDIEAAYRGMWGVWGREEGVIKIFGDGTD